MRKRKPEEHLNHEAWAIPYADLMTLLLAFFVVMYAVSVVNEGKYRVMSQSLVQAFNGSSHSIAPPQPVPGKVSAVLVRPADRRAPGASHVALPVTPLPALPSAPAPVAQRHAQAAQHGLDDIENQVRRALQPLIDRKLVVVRHKPDWLEIEIRTDILFPSGVAQLSSSAGAALQNLAAVLARFPNPLRVEGFTDDVPISSPQYPSNWELSAARAASVARLFASSGVAPDRLGIIGWGDVRPKADNATAQGRNQNRRVLVVVMNAQKNASPQPEDGQHLREIAGPTVVPTGGQKASAGRAAPLPDPASTPMIATAPPETSQAVPTAEESPHAVSRPATPD